MKNLASHAARFLPAVGACVFLYTLAASMAVEAADGRTAYEAVCKRCHGPVDERRSMLDAHIIPVVMLPLGPSLNGVFDRPAGILKGFKYSKGMQKFAASGAVWDRATLDEYLTDARKLVPGSYMFLKMPEPQRTSVIDYLEEVARYGP